MALDEYDDKASTVGMLKAADLPKGAMHFEISKPKLKEMEGKDKNGKPNGSTYHIFSLQLEILDDGDLKGRKVERSNFIKDQDSFNMCLGDLKRLGFDCDNWTKANNRKASVELERAMLLMGGMRFEAEIKASGTYTNINIKKRIDDGKPAEIGAKEIEEAVAKAKLENPFEEGAAGGGGNPFNE